MNLMSLKKSGKKTAITAATTFALANPLLATFVAGMGLAAWFTLRSRGGMR